MKLTELAKLCSSLKNYWIDVLTILTNYDLPSRLCFFILSFKELYRKGLWCLNKCIGVYLLEPERVKKGFY